MIRRRRIAGLLAGGRCDERGSAAGTSCVMQVTPSLGAVRLCRDPVMVVHVTRIKAVIASGAVSRTEVLARLRGFVPAGL